MSKPTKTSGTKGVVPRLRFPEFCSAPTWRIQPVSKVCTVNPPSGELPESFIYVDLESVEKGRLIRKTQIQRDGAPSRAQRSLQDQDVLFQIVRPYQRNNLLFRSDSDDDYVASTGYAQLRAHASPRFLYQSIHTDDFVARIVAKCTGSNYPAINPSDLAAIPVAIPCEDEQEKIAACLSSLDDLIAARADKLAALKQHKQGLLEQLFPREGETVPRLRFPEFQRSAHWQLTNLNHVIDELSEKSSMQDEHEVLTSSRRGLICQTDYYSGDDNRLTGRENIGFNVVPPGYITFRSRSDDGVFFFNENKLGITGIVSIYYPVFRLVGMNHSFFLALAQVNRERIGSYSIGTSQKVLSLNQLRRVQFRVPMLAEQQRIGCLLDSADSLITAASDQLAALKQHKQGLLQQLFPTLEEVAA